MDLNDLRTIVTALSFVVFAGIVWWAWSKRQRTRFNEAANLPFIDAELPDEIIAAQASKSTNVNGGRS
jgi:cytochrome c oxidase cbb3-type subunit IV